MAPYRVIALAASAGGLHALDEVLSRLPGDLPVPVLIVQHVARDRLTYIPNILDRGTPLRVKLAEEGERAEPGVAYVATPDHHLVLQADETLTLTQSAREHFTRPAADVLFRSCAETYGAGVIVVVLSGTGKDAANGAIAVQQAGGIVIVQDPATAAHPGMPQTTIELDGPDYILPLEEIAGQLLILLEATSDATAEETAS